GDNATNKWVEFRNCTVGIDGNAMAFLDIKNSLFAKVLTGIDINNQEAYVESTEFNSASGGYGIKVYQDVGTTATVSASKNCKCKNQLRGIYAKNTRMSIHSTVFEDNYMPVLITDAPNISH